MLAGGIAVLIFWCRQPVGICHCASLIFFLATTPLITGQPWKSAMKDCAFFIAGIIAASMPFFVWLYVNGAIHDMYLQSIKAAFFLGGQISDVPFSPNAKPSYNLFVRILTALFACNKTAFRQFSPLWALLPIVCLSIMAMLAIKRWRNPDSVKNDLPLYGLLLVSLASWMQYYPYPCIRHCYWAATPMIGLFAYGAWQLCSFKKKNTQIIMVCLILASVFGYDIGTRVYNGSRKIAIFDKKIEEPKVLRGMCVPFGGIAVTLKTVSRSINDALKQNSPPYLVNLTWDPLYSTFIGHQKNFHPVHGPPDLWNRNIYPDYRELSYEFINAKHPLVLWYAGAKMPGWTCVNVFNIGDLGFYMN